MLACSGHRSIPSDLLLVQSVLEPYSPWQVAQVPGHQLSLQIAPSQTHCDPKGVWKVALSRIEGQRVCVWQAALAASGAQQFAGNCAHWRWPNATSYM